MNPIKETIHKGKKNRGNKKQQLYINLSVFVGFILMFIWTSIYKKVFVDVNIVLLLLFSTSLIATFFLFKKYVAICGYTQYLKTDSAYNILIRVLTFVLIAMPFGNITVFTFLIINNTLVSEASEVIILEPKNIYESSRKGKNYTAFEITHNGITKKLRSWNQSEDEIQGKILLVKIRKGYFGYDFYEKYNFKSVENKW